MPGSLTVCTDGRLHPPGNDASVSEINTKIHVTFTQLSRTMWGV